MATAGQILGAILFPVMNAPTNQPRVKARKPQRDAQRSKVYTAENEALKPLAKRFKDTEACAKYISKTLNRAPIERRYGKAADQGTILVQKKHHGHAEGGRNVVRLPTWAQTDWVCLHELAHTLTIRTYGKFVASHGREYCSIYLDLVKFAMGKEAHDALIAAFKKHKVKYRLKRGTRTLSSTQRAAAVERLAAARAAKQMKGAEE